MKVHRGTIITALALAGILFATGGATASPPGDATAARPAPATAGWVTTWGGSAMAPSSLVSSVQALDNQTVRNIVHTSAPGGELRIRVSNAFGDRPVTVAAATVARQLRGAQLDAATVRQITFGASRSVRVAQGGSAVSDPVRIAVPAGANLAVSLYLAEPTGPATYHQAPQQTNYLATGDRTGDVAGDAFSTVGTWFFMDAVQVRGSARGSVVTVGDSTTDSYQSQYNANTRWPDYLARRLAAKYGASAPAVANEGISGNRVLSDSVCFGVAALTRLDRDVFSQPGVRSVILLEGINDLGFSQEPDSGCTAPNTEISVDQLIGAYQRIIALAHARGLRIYGGTLMPAEGFEYWNAAAEQKRLAVNEWIRHSRAFDGVIDFAAAVAYPGHPNLLDPSYDSGDHIHPNDGGYQAMANAIDLAMIS